MIEFVTGGRTADRQRKLAQAKLPPIWRRAGNRAHPARRGDDRKNAMASTAKRQLLVSARTQILNYVNGAELVRYSQVGVVTPDHTIRTRTGR
jgi:rhamnose utilization protein RhaD (predicted bifunctional aldolase and dehydrogenase)